MKIDIVSKICDVAAGLLQSKRLARAILVGVSILFVVYAVFTIALRISAPIQFDVFEGKELCKAYDYACGNDIYQDPGVGPAADIYTPLSPMLLSLVLRVVSPTFMWGRLLSMIYSVITGILFFRYLWPKQGCTRALQFLLVALFFSTAWRTNWFMCAVKPDALCHMLWIAAFVVALYGRRFSVVGSALLLVLAFYTKQTALFALPGTFAFLFLRRRRDGLMFALIYGVAFVVMIPVLKSLTGDWLPFYVFGRMANDSGHGFPVTLLSQHFFSLVTLPLILVATVFSVASMQRGWELPGYRLALFNLPFLVAGSVLTTASVGGNLNCMMPAFYGMLWVASFALYWWDKEHRDSIKVLWAAVLLLVMQFDANFPYHINKALGHFDQDFVEAVDFLKDQEGSMYAPSNNILTLLAGHPENDDMVLAWFVSAREDSGLTRIKRKMNSLRFDWLILTDSTFDRCKLTKESLLEYETIRRFGEWEVLHKRAQL